MKKLFLLILAIVVFNTVITAQVSGNTTLSSAGTYISKETTGQTTAYYFGVYGIGKETVNGTVKVYRTYFEFDLSAIPTNATIQTVTVYLSNGKIGYTQKLTQISSLNPSDLSSGWQAIGNGSTIHSGLAYSPSSFVSTPMKNAIQSTLANRKLTVGALSESESTEGSNTSVSLSMYVTYTRPLAQINFSAHNDMEGYVGGHIGVGINASATDRTSPYSASATEGQTANIEAYDSGNSWSSYDYVFNDSEAPLNKSNIQKRGGQQNAIYDNSSCSYTFLQNDNNSEFIAKLKKVCNATVQNSFVGVGNGGNIIVNGVTVSSPNITPVVKSNTITVSSNVANLINGIIYTFDHWDDGSTSSYKTYTINSNESHAAYYIGKPSIANRGLHFGTVAGDPVVLYWNEHPNPYVTEYRISRKPKSSGEFQTIGTVSRGTTTFTDYQYLLVSVSGGGTLMQYDVQPYYSLEGTYSDPSWIVCGANEIMPLPKTADNELNNNFKEIPNEYSITNYPNPFNPATTINYQLPENGFVTIKVYDILGKEIATLVNERKSAGFHNVSFDASRLTSGIYIYIINAGRYTQSKKMLLTK